MEDFKMNSWDVINRSNWESMSILNQGGDELEEYKDEEEYSKLYESLHKWDKKDIMVLKENLLAALNYFKNLPVSTRGLIDFYSFFDLDVNNLPSAEWTCEEGGREVKKTAKDIAAWLASIDEEGNAMMIIDYNHEIKVKIAHISKIFSQLK
jgi:hypothetical protein